MKGIIILFGVVSFGFAPAFINGQEKPLYQKKINLLENPGFELGKINLKKRWCFIDGWGAGGGRYSKEVMTRITVDSDVKLSGKRSLKLNNTNLDISNKSKEMRNKSASVISGKIPLISGNVYIITLWARGKTDNLELETSFDTWYKEQPSSPFRFFCRNKVQLTTKWAKYLLKVKVPSKGDKNYDSNCKSFRMEFKLFGKGIAWIDNITVIF